MSGDRYLYIQKKTPHCSFLVYGQCGVSISTLSSTHGLAHCTHLEAIGKPNTPTKTFRSGLCHLNLQAGVAVLYTKND